MKNTVGIMGTAMTPEQVAELARLAPTVLLALDADSAGQEAMLRAERLARQRKLAVRVVPLPVGSDPADLVQAQGAAAMASLVEASIPFVQFRVRKTLAAADASSAEGKDRAIDELRPAFAPDVLPPSALREELLQERRGPVGAAAVAGVVVARRRRAAASTCRALGAAPRRRLVRCPLTPSASSLPAALRSRRSGAELLRAIDPERDLSSPLMRRAHSHLLGHLDAPDRGIAGDDDELRTLMSSLVLWPDREKFTERGLRALRLQLEFLGVSRQRDHAPPGEKAKLALRREELHKAWMQALS